MRNPAAVQVVAQGGGRAVRKRQAGQAAGRGSSGAPAAASPTFMLYHNTTCLSQHMQRGDHLTPCGLEVECFAFAPALVSCDAPTVRLR